MTRSTRTGLVVSFMTVVFVSLLTSGCALRQNRTVAYQPSVYSKCTNSIRIVSEPPGALIEVNDDLKGKAPLSIEVDCPVALTKNKSVLQYTEELRNSEYAYHIRALPTQPGHCSQSKRIVTTRTPKTIYFPMALCPIPGTVYLDGR